MVMIGNTAWIKNNLREIKNTLERYFAIMAIIALGVGFFSGLMITRTAMVNNLDTYVYDQQMYDFRLVSSLGLTEDDVEFFSNLEDIIAEGAISVDFIADMGIEDELVLRAHSMTSNINLLYLRHGRLAKSGNECILDSRFFSEEMIGTKIRVASSNAEDTIDLFAYDEYTVVGIADSVNYLNYDRGTTNLAGGQIDAFVYIPESGFKTDYYTEILIRMKGYYEVYSKEYNDLISQKEDSLKEMLEHRGELRYLDIVKEAEQEVLNAQKEYNDAYNEYLREKANAEKELNEALIELRKADQKIRDQEKKLRDAEKKIAAGEREYLKSLQDWERALQDFENNKAKTLEELELRQKELEESYASVTSAMEQIEESGILNQYKLLTETILSLETTLSQIEDTESDEYLALQSQLYEAKEAVKKIEKTGIIEQYAELEKNLTEIKAGQNELEKSKEEAIDSFARVQAELEEAKAKLNLAKEELEKNKRDIRAGWDALEKGKAEYEKGIAEYEDARKEAEENFAKAERELVEAQKEIEKAWKEIEDIPKPKVFVISRKHNVGYTNFENDSSIVEGIAKVLPIYFFMVAALVCITTMTRMVDEQRTQIGTLKALGYSDGAIIRKYIFYSGSAAALGSIIGFFLGTKFFPAAIWKAYSMIYDISSIEYVFDGSLAAVSLIVSLFCSAGVTYISCKAELLQMPAQLIRPKAPKPGKRVLLELVPPIWNRLSFLHKVSIRNIFRYKGRFFMTVLGIAGCTSLIVAALGIGDSIGNIANDQFDTIMIYDYHISFTEGQSYEQRENFTKEFQDILSECVFVSIDEKEVIQGNQIKKANIVATDDPDITKVIKLYSNGEIVPYPTINKVAVNEKLAQELGLNIGDKITIRNDENDTVRVEISCIFENYVGNYLFMTGQTYESLFEEEIQYTSAYATTDSEDLYAVSASLSKGENVSAVTVLNDMKIMVDNMMNSLDYIIWLVVICACVLGIVVIYNLNNINITERSREIATIKVLGFYERETISYVFRETIILTIIATLFGLGLGRLLHMYVMDQIKIEAISFKEQIFASSYLIATLITIMITLLVNLVLNRKIDKINMTESLKSVE